MSDLTIDHQPFDLASRPRRPQHDPEPWSPFLKRRAELIARINLLTQQRDAALAAAHRSERLLAEIYAHLERLGLTPH